VLSRDLSPWEAVTLSADYMTRVFEVPYRQAKDWYGEIPELESEAGATHDEIYFVCTTWPRCA